MHAWINIFAHVAVRLFAGQDFEGKLCGMGGQKTDTGVPLSNFELLYYSMNVTASLNYAVGGYFSASNSTPFNPVAVGADMAVLLDPWTFYSDFGNSLISTFETYFIPDCVSVCDYNLTADSSANNIRTYVWEGPSDPSLEAKWLAYVEAAKLDPSLMEPFTFEAFPLSVCPYAAKFCVPLQYADFASLLNRYCIPKIVDSVSSYVPQSWGDATTVGFGSMMGDIQITWPLLVGMAFAGLVIAMVFLLILRMCVGVFIWLTIFLCFLLIILGAVSTLLWSQKCVGESLFSEAQSIHSTSAGLTVLQGQRVCENGFSIPDSSGRWAVQIISYVLFGLGGLYLILIILLCKRIRIGIAMNKVAAQFVGQNMSTLLVPLFQTFTLIAWWALWLASIVYTVTVIPAGYRNMDDTWTGDYQAAVSACSGASGVYIRSYADVVPVYACKEAKYYLSWEFWYSIFSLIWVNVFVVSSGQMIIAGAVGVWYFTPNHSKGSLGTYPVRTGFRNTFIYHMGTLAFGSLVLALVRIVRLLFFWQSWISKTSNPTNPLLACFIACTNAVLGFVDKVIRFLNKNAFIQTALMGTNFCVSCAHAVSLILRNAVRIGSLAVIGTAVHFLGMIFITVSTGFLGWGLLAHFYDGQIASPIIPTLVCLIMGYFIGSVVISVFSISVDSILQCFVSDEELHKSEGGAKYTPKELESFLSDHQPKIGPPVNLA